MRTKALIGAAIAVAAGIISASAQVYSVNVVGYVNVPTTGGTFSLIATPLDDGTNRLADLLATAPDGTAVQVWNGYGFVGSTKGLHTGIWSSNYLVPPGTGYFIKPASTYTNTFVGNVDCAPGGGQTNLALAGGTFQLVGSIVPFSGALTDSGTNTLNFGPSMPDGSSIQYWGGNGFLGSTKGLHTGIWSTNITVSVGEGFFVKPASATTWTQTLN